jgi:hypothetical protein
MVVLFYPGALAIEWYFGAKVLGRGRAWIPVFITLCSRASLELFTEPLPLDYVNLLIAGLVFVAPIPVVFCLGRLGARISKVRRHLRPFVFALWIIAIWGASALYVQRGFTLFCSI